MLSAIYGRRPPRRPARGIEQLRATRRSQPFRLSELGAWAAPAARDVPALLHPDRAGATVPRLVRASATLPSPDDPVPGDKLAIDWPPLATAAHPGPQHRHPDQDEELRRMAAPLVAQAFAGDGPRERVVLVTSVGSGEGRTFSALGLALGVVRERAVLLVDADPGAAGTAAWFGLAAAPGWSDALADPDLEADRLILATARDRLALLGPGSTRPDLLELIASRRTIGLLRDLLAADPTRLILIDGPPLARPEGQVLAAFAGQVVLVVAAGQTRRDALETALEQLGRRPNVNLLLNRARATRAQEPPRPPPR